MEFALPSVFPPSEEAMPVDNGRAGFLAPVYRPLPPSRPLRASDISPQPGRAAIQPFTVAGAAPEWPLRAAPASLHSDRADANRSARLLPGVPRAWSSQALSA